MDTSIHGEARVPVDVSALVENIERTGFAVIKDFVSAKDIGKAQASIEEAVRKNHNETVAVYDFAEFNDTFLHALERDPAFKTLCDEIYRTATGRQAPSADLVPSLRCLSGPSGQGQSMIFHYDTYVLTIILPIIIPTEGETGKLVLLPNRRGIRSFYFRNLLDKILIDNKLAQRRFHRLHADRSPKLRYIDMKPGNAYLFWGYRSVHTNEACDPDRIRSTAIFHYADPHAGSVVKRVLGR